ncbi:hypothetical protein [Verrucosispora sp. TAA-831]|uniref:hypothetical protein n=1 Tax=Verrucosispora sp. TAA-831 TaxID=3422227 RepID=UPI003D6FB804
MDVTTATPAEIDTRLAEIDRRASQVEQRIAAAAVTIHYAIGERPTYLNRKGHKAWPTTDEQAIDAARDRGDERVPRSAGGYTFADLVGRWQIAVADLAAAAAEAAPLDAEFARRGGWSRFFTVQQNSGHIHSSTSCQTCNRGGQRTSFAWNPELSGLSMDEAIARFERRAHVLCTVCFPDAPVEWTVREARTDRCAGGGRAPVKDTTKRQGMRWYGQCTECNDRQQVNSNGTVRAHKAAVKVEAKA